MGESTSLVFLFVLSSILIATAQDRAPHGLAYQSPIAYSPSTYDFFHPKASQQGESGLCTTPKCAQLPLSAAQVRATQIHQPALPTSDGSKSSIGAGTIAGIVLGFTFAVLLAMGAYYVVVTRRANSDRAKSAQPDV